MRKVLLGVFVAVFLALVLRRAFDIVGPDFCNGCDPKTSWWCWIKGCPDPDAGGGGSGAS